MRKAQWLVLVVVITAVPAVLAPAAPKAATPVAGVWAWDHWWDEKVLPSGVIIMTGAEHGYWSGGIEGTGYEPFFAAIRPDGSLGAWIRSDFQGFVNVGDRKVYGEMTIMITVTIDMTTWLMEGRWVIQNGSGDLKRAHGHGTWMQIAEQAGWYEGYVMVD